MGSVSISSVHRNISLLFLLSLFPILGIISDGYAQDASSSLANVAEDCGTALSRADHAYELGAFREVLSILAPCLPSGIADEDVWRGYRLQAISYLLLDQPDSAEESTRQMLRRNPFYRAVPEQDPYEFAKLLESLGSYPEFGAGVFLDLLQPQVNLLQSNSLTQTFANAGDYAAPLKINVGAEFLYRPSPSIALGIEAMLISEDFTRTTVPIQQYTSVYDENLSSLAVPLFARWNVLSLFGNTKGAFQPFIEAGGFGQWMTSITAKVTLTSTSSNSGSSSSLIQDGSPQDRTKSFNYGTVVGIGVSWAYSNTSEIVLRGRYWNGLVDLTQPSARYTSPLFLPAYYEDDDIALRGIEITLGVNLQFGFQEYKSDDRSAQNND